MPQGPIATQIYGKNPANVTKPALTDAAGNLVNIDETNPYVTCPGNATTTLGGNGTIGDVLRAIVITPAVLNAGNVSIKDGTTVIPVYVGSAGNQTVPNPITVSFGPGLQSAAGGWSVVTPVSVTVIAVGKFTA